MKQADSLAGRLRQFFRENPTEVLSFDDIAAKFETTRDKAKTACMHLRNAGVITTMTVAMINQDGQKRK